MDDEQTTLRDDDIDTLPGESSESGVADVDADDADGDDDGEDSDSDADTDAEDPS